MCSLWSKSADSLFFTSCPHPSDILLWVSSKKSWSIRCGLHERTSVWHHSDNCLSTEIFTYFLSFAYTYLPVLLSCHKQHCLLSHPVLSFSQPHRLYSFFSYFSFFNKIDPVVDLHWGGKGFWGRFFWSLCLFYCQPPIHPSGPFWRVPNPVAFWITVGWERQEIPV